jgi:hypothetical protein
LISLDTPADKELKLLILFLLPSNRWIDVSIIILLPLFSPLYFLPAIPPLLFFSSSSTKYASNLTNDFTYHKLYCTTLFFRFPCNQVSLLSLCSYYFVSPLPFFILFHLDVNNIKEKWKKTSQIL